MSNIAVVSEENFKSTDSLDGLLRSMAGPSANMEPKLDAQMLEDFLNQKQIQDQNSTPYMEIIEQPKQKELRFRYECEGRSAGSLPGQRSDLDRKTYPTIKIHNYHGRIKVIASLVTRERRARPHPHGLVGKDCERGVCRINFEPTEKMQISFPNLGIQCVKQKEVIQSLQMRERMNIDPFGWFAQSKVNLSKCKPKSLEFEMNVVCICFQAFIPDPNNPDLFTVPLAPVVTHPIFDKKGATLHIARCDRSHGSVKGGDEVFILCDKVQRDDIAVIFFSEELQWEAKAEFGPNDIHRQVAIVCRTPKFKDLKIDKPVNVQFMLRRPSDLEQSEPVFFTYTPIDSDAAQIGAKRKRKATNFTSYFKGPVDSSIKVETLDETRPSCSYAEAYGIATTSSPMPPQPGGSQTSNVKQRLRGKLLMQKNDGYLQNVDVRVPPSDQMSTPQDTSSSKPRSRRAPKRSPKMAAQFNVSHGMNFGTMTSSPATAAQLNAAVEGLLTINPALLSNSALTPTTSAAAVPVEIRTAQPSPSTNMGTFPTSVADPSTAMQLLHSIQEGNIKITTVTETGDDTNDLQTEAERAVQQLLADVPGPSGPSVQAVSNPSAGIDLNNAGQWYLEGMEVSQELADEISAAAAQLMPTIQSGDLENVDLTQLQDANMGGEILISDPNSPAEMMVEDGVNDSVTIPFSNSIELGTNPPVPNNETSESQN